MLEVFEEVTPIVVVVFEEVQQEVVPVVVEVPAELQLHLPYLPIHH